MSAPYNKSIIVSVFVRVANQQPNPAKYLMDILLGGFTAVTQGDATVLTATTTGGSSASFTLPANLSRADIMEITELALRNIETGVDAPLAMGPGGSPIPATVKQLPRSQRVVSFGQFGNIRH